MVQQLPLQFGFIRAVLALYFNSEHCQHLPFGLPPCFCHSKVLMSVPAKMVPKPLKVLFHQSNFPLFSNNFAL